MNNLVSVSNVQSGMPEMPNLVRGSANEVNKSIKNDFISHPQQYPIEIKRLRQWPLKRWPWARKDSDKSNASKSAQASVGLRLLSQHYFETGTQVEVSIPLRSEAQFFTGTVVLVRELSDGFEIGLWLANIEDEARARIVEKICHTECDLGNKHVLQSTSPSVNRNRRARKIGRDSSWLDLSGKTLLGH